MQSLSLRPCATPLLRWGHPGTPRRGVFTRFQPAIQQQSAEQQPYEHEHLGNDGTTQVPLEYYQLLQVKRFASVQTVRRAHQALLQDDFDAVGYSQDTCYIKALYLKAAADVLMDPYQRTTYDRNLREHGTAPLVPVAIHDLPGVIALLQASGDCHTSYQLAHHLLTEGSTAAQLRQQECRDVALAGTLAALDMAGSAQASHSGGASAAYTALAQMLGHLQQHCMTGPVLHQAQQVQQDLAVRFVLEQLSGGVSTAQGGAAGYSNGRAAALRVLQGMLWPAAGAVLTASEQEDLLLALRGCLLAEEQVALFDAAPKDCMVQPQQLYDAAMASIAVGYQSGSRRHLKHALQLLASLRDMGVPGELHRDVACCSSLIGDNSTLRSQLQQRLQHQALTHRLFAAQKNASGAQAGDSGRTSPQQQLQDNNGDGSSEVDAAVDAAVEAWLQEHVLPRFPDTKELHVDMAHWRATTARSGLWPKAADDVLQLLSASKDTSSQVYSTVAANMPGLGKWLQQLLLSLLQVLARTLQQVQQLFWWPRPEATPTSSSSSRSRPQSQQELSQPPAVPLEAVNFDSSAHSSSSSSPFFRLVPAFLGAAALGLAAAACTAWAASHRRATTQPVCAEVIVQANQQGARDSASAAEAGGPGAVLAAWSSDMWQRLSSGNEQSRQQATSLPATVPSPAAPAATGGLSTHKVQQLLQQWHAARQAALGPQHSMKKLQQLVAPPTLEHYKEEVLQLQQGARYCNLGLQELKVLSLEPASGGSSNSSSNRSRKNARKAEAPVAALKVKATIREACSVYEEGRLLHSCDNNYLLEVLLIEDSRQQGTWKVQEIKPLPSLLYYALPC